MGDHIHALIVEDNPNHIQAIERTLQGQGIYHYEVAVCLTEAIQKLEGIFADHDDIFMILDGQFPYSRDHITESGSLIEFTRDPYKHSFAVLDQLDDILGDVSSKTVVILSNSDNADHNQSIVGRCGDIDGKHPENQIIGLSSREKTTDMPLNMLHITDGNISRFDGYPHPRK